MDGGNRRSGFVAEFLEAAIAQISEHYTRPFVGELREFPFHLGVNTSGGHEQIRKPVVVEVDDSCAPADVVCLNADLCSTGPILEVACAVVVVEPVGVVGEMSFEDVEMTVEVIVPDS